MADQNPYMTDQNKGRRRGAHFAQKTTPPIAPTPLSIPKKRKRSKAPLVLLLLLALLGAGWFGYQRFADRLNLPDLPSVNLPSFKLPSIELPFLDKLGLGGKKVAITVDGEEVRVAEGSSVQDVFDALQPAVQAGNLLSVSGSVLGEGSGEPYAATLDGEAVSVADAASTTVGEGASLTFANGADLTEDYTSETVVTSTPKLVKQVQEGTSDQGYMVQHGVVQYVYQWGRQGTKEVRTGSQSGETADGAVNEGQDCIIMCQDIHPDNDEKLVALTFDDGPTNYTEPVMNILDQYGIKATFNLIGEQVEDCAGVVEANCASGNQITSHTWNHPDLPQLDAESLQSQLGDTFDVIKNVGGYDTSTIRAPYGDIDMGVWLNSGGRMTLSVYWTHDSEDWKLPGVDAIVDNCTSYMAPGSVILMHDGGGDRDQNLEAIPRIIEAWQNAGYRFVTVEELMASDSSIPEECTKNFRTMPEDAVWPTELVEEETTTVE